MIILIAGGLLPIAVGCSIFVYFALTKPEMLQSEDYQLRHEALQMIQKQTGTGVIDLSLVTGIANPAAVAAPVGEKEGH
jgi:hypothetical protein